ncbi:acetoacetate decarboxylase family protein [Cupriavidus sp. D384]|uniref:acetoacetate decarboxylase family protein n=1 Tax=Cupriavidus sp. D384 TaxID=1538095 RepID=UPI000835012B|nr:acetoacetate decarboxylase family protein [Cupriavidus sp. D384]
MNEKDLQKVNVYRMPTAFGPALGPRRPPEGVTFDPSVSPRKQCAYVAFRTDGSLLKKMLPMGFTLRGDPVVIFEFSHMTEIDWLAGRGYNMLSVRIPVRFSYDSGQKVVEGFFQPVIWENLTEPIISGREELGWNKIYAELPVPERADGKVVFRAEWLGFKFLELTLTDIESSDSGGLATSPVLHRKYIPATEQWGESDVDYITMTPAGGSKARALESFTAKAALSMVAPRWEDMPTQHEIVCRLAALPRFKYIHAGIYSTVGGKDLSDQVRFLR